MGTMINFEKFHKRLPMITATVFMLFWGAIYLFFSKLHGMQAMFDQEFPFLVAWLLGFQNETMSMVSGTLFAILDGGILGVMFGWVFQRIIRALNH